MRSAMHAARQSPERGGALIWMMHLHINQKSDYDYDMKQNSPDVMFCLYDLLYLSL